MKINVLFTHLGSEELYFTGKTVVVIDVLRATTTIATALANGAKEIIPVNSIEFAMKFTGGQTLLGGERHTKKIEGFTLGNSPAEYTSDIVNGKSIILYTTNGSKAIVKAKFAETTVCCSFNNLEIVAKYLIKLNKNFEIVCSGNNNYFSLEDSVCAGVLISDVMKTYPDVQLNDGGEATLLLAKQYNKKLLKMLENSEHGKVLIENGYQDDVVYASKLNTVNVVPIAGSDSIRALSAKETEKLLN